MSQPNDEPAEKYKGLFQGLRFKFEGLQDDTEEALVNLVKVLGAEVSDDAPFTFVQKSYFEKEENRSRRNMYNINYINDSVKEMQALEMDEYKFAPDRSSQHNLNDEPMCYAAQFIHKIDSCQKCYYERVFCKECIDIEQESQKAANHVISATDSSCESDEEVAASPKAKSIKTEAVKRFLSSESTSNSNDEEQIRPNGARRKPVRKRSKNSSDMESNHRNHKDDSSETDVENDSSKSNGSATNNASDKQVEDPIKEHFGGEYSGLKQKLIVANRKNVEEDVKTDDDLSDKISPSKSNSEDEKKPNLSQKSEKSSQWIQSSKSKTPIPVEKNKEVTDTGSTSDISLHTDDEDEKYFKEKVWWQLHAIPPKERCTFISCSFEPGPHRAHFPPARFMSLVEKKIMVKYLVMTRSISFAKGKNIFETMRKDGYLVHRSVETLRNCFRRTIIKEIENYKLDEQYLNEFKKLRVNSHHKVKKEKS